MKESTKWKCNECGKRFIQNVIPDAMNEIVCPSCSNSHWLLITFEDIKGNKKCQDE